MPHSTSERRRERERAMGKKTKRSKEESKDYALVGTFLSTSTAHVSYCNPYENLMM